MSAVSKRVYKELQAALAELKRLNHHNGILITENAVLRREKATLQHETKLAYLEGLDQGRAYMEAV